MVKKDWAVVRSRLTKYCAGDPSQMHEKQFGRAVDVMMFEKGIKIKGRLDTSHVLTLGKTRQHVHISALSGQLSVLILPRCNVVS